MNFVEVNGVALAYERSGHGDPLLLVHGSNLVSGLSPLASALATTYPSLQQVSYHRRAMGLSAGREFPITVQQQAADTLGLLDALGIESTHLLGYSYGGVVALEAAITAPTRFRSLILVEPMITTVPSAREFMSMMAPAMAHYAAGDMAAAVDATFAGLGGARWHELLTAVGTDALDQAVRDTEVFYRAEAPSMQSWTLERSHPGRLDCPVLSVVGSDSGPVFAEGRELLHEHFPHCADADIPGANHLLNLQAPEDIAAVVAPFIRQAERERSTSEAFVAR